MREYEVDSLVFRWYPPEANQKLGLGWIGPYKVVRKLSDITYEIERCSDHKRKIVHVDHLKPVILPQHEVDDYADTTLQGPSYQSVIDQDNTNESVIQEVDSANICSPPKFSRTGRLIKPPAIYSP